MLLNISYIPVVEPMFIFCCPGIHLACTYLVITTSTVTDGSLVSFPVVTCDTCDDMHHANCYIMSEAIFFIYVYVDI